MDVKALQARLAAFAAERGWDETHNPRNLAIALAGEAGMLLDLFRWLTDAQSHRIESEYKREAAAEAIADLILHTLRLADKLDIDVERAIAKKLAENDANYPRPVSAHAPPVVVAPVVVPAPKPAERIETAESAERAEWRAEKAEKKEMPRPVEAPKTALPPEPVAPPPALATPEAKREAEPPKPPVDKALPTWLDGILPARSPAARKKLTVPPKAAPEPLKAPAPPTPPETPKRPETEKVPEPPPVVAQIEAAPPPLAEAPESEPESEPETGAEPEAPPPPTPPPDRYTHLDTDAAKAFAKSLAKRVDSARSDDPLLRELHDEVETLRRTLYSPTPKHLWMGESLKTIRAVLEEAATHAVAEEIRAEDYIAQINRMLSP